MDPKTRGGIWAGTVAQRTEKERPWRTREDPFGEVWEAVERQDSRESGPGGQDAVRVAAAGIPRAIQRRADPDTATAVKLWRVTEGPAQESISSARTRAGRLCASDFTHMAELGITIGGQTFEHLVYHSC